jgi:hypothetical protein
MIGNTMFLLQKVNTLIGLYNTGNIKYAQKLGKCTLAVIDLYNGNKIDITILLKRFLGETEHESSNSIFKDKKTQIHV